jgi:hypothetical protein
VQQPYNNPGNSPEMLRKASKQKKYGDLQVFCKLKKPSANYRTAFTRQRSLVRSQHRPPRFLQYLQVKRERKPQKPNTACDFVQQRSPR